MMHSHQFQHGDQVPLRSQRMPAISGRCRSFRAAISFRLLVGLISFSSLAVLSLVVISCWMEPDEGRQIGGQSIRDWVSSLGDSDSKIRNEAVEVLIKIGSEAAPYLHRSLRDRNVERRRDAVLVLQKIRPKDHSSVLALSDALYDQDRWVRCRAAQTLRTIGATAKDAVLPLASALGDSDPLVRLAAAQALGEIGKPSILAHPALLEAMQDERVFVRRAASAAMLKIMPSHGRVNKTDSMLRVEY